MRPRKNRREARSWRTSRRPADACAAPCAYESSPGFARLFCDTCGTPLGFRAKDDPKLATFRLGCLDDPNAIRPEFHIFTSTQVSWCDVADNLPRHTEGAPELVKLWAESEGWQAID